MKKFRIFSKIVLVMTLVFAFLSVILVGCTNNNETDKDNQDVEKIETYRVKFYWINSVGWSGNSYKTSPNITITWTSSFKEIEAHTYISFNPQENIGDESSEILKYYQASFLGWYLDSDYNSEFIGRVESDMVLYAKYNRQPYYNGGRFTYLVKLY